MTTTFTLPAQTRSDMYRDSASVGDVERYSFDCTAWQDDNGAITSATWVIESGQASVSNQSVSGGVVSADLSFAQRGKVLISVLLDTGTLKKKVWLAVRVVDVDVEIGDDYGICS